MTTGTIDATLPRKIFWTILFCTFLLCFSKFLYCQDVKNNTIGGYFYANYSHTYLDKTFGFANAYYCHLSLIYGRPLRNYYLPSNFNRSYSGNYLAFQPFIYGLKVDFEPEIVILEKGNCQGYVIQCNPYLRIYSSFNLFLEAGLGIDFVNYKSSYKVPPITSANTYVIGSSVRDLGYYLEGGIGYEIRLTKNVSIDPVIIYRYRKGFNTIDESENYLLETKYGLYPYVAFQFYF